MSKAPDFDQRPHMRGMRFFDYVEWVGDSSDLTSENEPKPLGLPPVQRTALWRPKQILDLWDSLLRGMPIGMFYLIESTGKRRALYGSDSAGGGTVDVPGGYDLLDGQQRTRAMMLALRSPEQEGRCLWVDLGARSDGEAISLRLTTRSQPFGYDAHGTKLELKKRRQARTGSYPPGKAVVRGDDGNREAYDHELFDYVVGTGRRPPLPFDATPHVVPLREFVSAWNASGEERGNFRAAAMNLLDASAIGPELDRNLSLVVASLQRLENAYVPVLLVNPTDFGAGPDGETEGLLRLFERIGANGTALSDDERLYSIYKYYEPGVHDAVTAIEADEEVGRVMTATKIAGTALRIAAVQEPDSRTLSVPDVKSFARKMSAADSALRNELNKLIAVAQIPAESDGSLAIAFRALFFLLTYCPKSNPKGLPKVMLTELAPDLIQALVYWVVLAQERGLDLLGPNGETEKVRGEMIRFALFWHLCSTNDSKCGQLSYGFIKQRAENVSAPHCWNAGFPGKQLYQNLTGQTGGEVRAFSLITPALFRAYCHHEPSARWLSWTERFQRKVLNNQHEEVAWNLFRTWWWSRGKMLLWLQRSYLSREFVSYDPRSGRDEDKPYDLDHMCASSQWGFNWNNADRNKVEGNFRVPFEKYRNDLGNGIGNLWWVGSSLNRAWGDVSTAVKMVEPTAQVALDEVFDVGSKADWKAVSEDTNSWGSRRFMTFQYAVEERAIWLYQRFYEDASFAAWESVGNDSGVETALPDEPR